MMRRSKALILCLVLACLGGWPLRRARAESSAATRAERLAGIHCPRCALAVGTGTTFFGSHFTDGIVLPLLLEIDQSRWEVGVFRFLTAQYLKEPLYPPSTVSAEPYWGFSLLRRWQVLHRAHWKLFLGIGASFQTQTNLLDSTRWNFAYLLAVRYALSPKAFLELSVRHWSNAWLRLPNRGQNIVLLGVGLR